MKKLISVALVTAVLTACGESPSSSTDADTPVDNVPVSKATIAVGDMGVASYDDANGTLVVQISLDGDSPLQPYIAAGALNGYSRFTQQDDALDRKFTAFAGEADDGSIQAVVAMDGGQFNKFFGGAAITQNTYTAPTTGLASYAGAYVGLTNIGPGLNIPVGADDSLTPFDTTPVTGTVFLNADFAGNNVNGAIYDRVFDPEGLAINLQDTVLTVTDFAADGSFDGTAQLPDQVGTGTYTGAFGGTGASHIAGIISLESNFLDKATDSNGDPFVILVDTTNAQETGIL